MTTMADRNRILVLSVPGLLILLFLFFIPVLLILLDAFGGPDGGFTLATIIGVLSDPDSWNIAGFTLLQASLSTVCSLLLALPGAYLLSHYSFRSKRMVRAILQVPFVLPSILVVLGFVVFFGNSGVLNSLLMRLTGSPTPPFRLLYSFKAIIAAHTFYNFPIALSLIASYWEHLSDHQELAAATLGTGPLRGFFSITLPRLAPAILSASSLIFLFCFTSFSIILVLGGGPRFTTLEVQIYQLARMQFDLPKAASYALFSLVISLAVLYVYIASERRLVVEHSQTRRMRRIGELSAVLRLLFLLYCLLVVLLITSPLASIVATSFLKPLSRAGELVFTLDWYRQLFGIGKSSLQFSGASQAIRSTLLIAGSTVIVNTLIAYSFSSLISLLSRRGRSWSQMLIMLPMAISSVVIGLGYSLIAANLRQPRMVYLLIVCAHIVITLPFMIRAILPTYIHAVDRFLPVAMTLGARPFQGYRHVVFPAVLSSTLSGAVFVFAISSGEMHATLMLSGSTVSTIPILLYRLIGSYNFHAACALGTVLMILSILLFMAAGKREVL